MAKKRWRKTVRSGQWMYFPENRRNNPVDRNVRRLRKNKNKRYHGWHLDTRCFGTALCYPVSLGFERLLLFSEWGMTNIRDVILSRVPQKCRFLTQETIPENLKIINRGKIKVKELDQVVVRFCWDPGDGNAIDRIHFFEYFGHHW